MQINSSRNGRKNARSITLPAQVVRACALGILALGGAAACETVASPEMAPAENVVSGGAIGGNVLNVEGFPVPGALVRTPGGAETVTDAAGQFRISGLPATPRLAVTVEAPGYDGTTAIYAVRSGVELRRPILIKQLPAATVIAANTGGTVTFAGGGGEVDIPANAFAGVAPGAAVSVQASYIDTQDPAQFSTAPGDFTGITTSGAPVQIESFGMINVIATDAQGQRLDLAPGQQATIRLPLRGGTAVPTRALWTFDTQTGNWVEAGTATVTPTSIDATVSTLAPRLNVDTPFAPRCIAVQVFKTDGVTPRPNEYVTVNGVSYAGFTQGWTGTSGVVQFQVPSTSQVLIKAGTQQQVVPTPPAGVPGCPLVATFAI